MKRAHWGLGADHAQDLLAREISRLPEDGLLALVVDARVPRIADALAVDAPAGVGARRFLNVVLRVVALAQGKQLHDFAGKILVGLARVFGAGILLAASRAIEIKKHRGVLRHGDKKLPEGLEGIAAQRLVLEPEEIGITHFLEAGGEVAMPEKGHLFLERTQPQRHPANPPVAQVRHLGEFDAGAFPAQFPFRFVVRGAAQGLVRREKLGIGIRVSPVRGGRLVGDLVVIHQPRNSAFQSHLVKILDFLWAPAKPCPVQQMPRRGGIPVGSRQRRQHYRLNQPGRLKLRSAGYFGESSQPNRW